MSVRVVDDFARTVAAGGLGTATIGGVITALNGATRMSVNGSAALFAATGAAQTTRAAYDAAVSAGRFDLTALVSLNLLPGPVGGAAVFHSVYIYARTSGTWNGVGTENYYRLGMEWVTAATTGVASTRLQMQKRVAGVDANVGSLVTSSVVPTAGMLLWLRFRGLGTALEGKVWQDGTPEPAGWLVSGTDADLTTGKFALASYSQNDTAATAGAPHIVSIDDFAAINWLESEVETAEVLTWYDTVSVNRGGYAFPVTDSWVFAETVSVYKGTALALTMTWADAVSVAKSGPPVVNPCAHPDDYRRGGRARYWGFNR